MKNIYQLFSRYFVSVKPMINEYHQIHKADCPFLPEKEVRIFLGHFDSGKEALTEGKSYFKKSECCRFCMKEQQQDRKELAYSEIGYSADYKVSTIIFPSFDDTMHSFQN